MSARITRPQRRGSSLRGWIAAIAALAVITTIAVVSSGFDSREVPRAEPNVWVARDAGQYARVNTETGEIDTVRKVSEPSDVLQLGSDAVVLTHGNGQAWSLNEANPQDLVGESDEAIRMPDGTREALTAGEFMLVRTESGRAYVGRDVHTLHAIDPTLDDPGASGETENSARFVVDAIALDEEGQAALYSAAAGEIRLFDARSDSFIGGTVELPAAARAIVDPQLALVSGDWVLVDAEIGTVFRSGGSETSVAFEGAPRLQLSGAGDGPGAGGGTDALVADVAGLWSIRANGEAERIVSADGVPARPAQVDDTTIAAWIGQDSGAMWRADTRETQPLNRDASASQVGDADPHIFTNGGRAVLGEMKTGMLWTVPDGRPIPLAQWTISDPPKEEQGTVVVDEVAEQVAPTAKNDAFGVRAGEPSQLQVLLNDFDANKRDVLTIVPESLEEAPLPESFGTLELLPDGQSLMVHPMADASGTASFSYRVTDGGLESSLATVTLTAVSATTNTAPEWCPVDGCQREWEVPAVAPGGTLSFPILEGWVDPEGDPMLLTAVEVARDEDPARAIVTSDGRLALRHTDANAGSSDILLVVSVSDGRGAITERELQVAVRPNAAAQFAATARTVQVGGSMQLRPLERVSGGSGAYALIDATVQSGEDIVRATTGLAENTVDVTALEVGVATLSVVMRDTTTGAEFSGVVRVTATDEHAPLALPPLRAFVRPQADSTVEVLGAIPGEASRALSVSEVEVRDGQLRADVLEHSRVRVAGSTPDGGPGRIGAADVTVVDGSLTATGRLTVFQVSESSTGGAVAIDDAAVVRAGSIVDIRVLDNDIASPGERLVLHPEIVGSGTNGELAFASGNVLRYLAPKSPGTYRVSYSTYGASSPEIRDTGTVVVTVLPGGANADPSPQTLTVRLSAGEQSTVQVPVSGVDPDGDRVRLDGVVQGADAQVTASLARADNTIAVSATSQAEPGLTTLDYTVNDGRGGSGIGALRVIVTDVVDTGAPVVSTDHVRLAIGNDTPAVVHPLDNDVDPARGSLSITSIEPNLPGGKRNPEYAKQRAKLDVSRMSEGIVTVAASDTPDTLAYRYTVSSSASSSTSDGLILVHFSEHVGAQAPAVSDTLMNVRDRSELASTGVDVVTDKVRWTSGDVSKLSLSLWSQKGDTYRAEGGRIFGTYNPEGDLVVFKLTGRDASGIEVSSYGFLIIPPLDELRVTLKPDLTRLEVNENKTVDATAGDLVDLGPDDRIELRQGSFPVSRTQASCQSVSPTGFRYSAGSEGPWDDVCLIDVRLEGQKSWTALPIPVTIIPRAPVVQLEALTRTIAPGQSETVKLRDMVRWQGGREGDPSQLKFSVSGGSALFTDAGGVSGETVTVEARADAVTGSQETLSVSVSGAGEARAALVLRIGEAPKDSPRGATIDLQCTVGSPCSTDVVGVAGEHDPFAGKPGGGLTLVSVQASSCSVGAVSRSGKRGISVDWPEQRGHGGSCTIGFTVRDAQGRVGEGRVELDALGVPRMPSSITPTGASTDSVTLTVALNQQDAHPAVSRVELVTEAGREIPANCTITGASASCVVQGVPSGKENQRTYYARAVNSVGASDRTANGATTWAYAPPPAPSISVTAIENPANTSQTVGRAELNISRSESARRFLLSIDGGPSIEVGRGKSTHELAPGTHTFSVIPEDRELPPGYTGSGQGGAGEARVTVGAAPVPGTGAIIAAKNGSGSATISTGGWTENYAGPITFTYDLQRVGGPNEPSCKQAVSSPEFTGLERYQSYSGVVCAQTRFGQTAYPLPAVWVGGNPDVPNVVSGYRVSATPETRSQGTVREYRTITKDGQPGYVGIEPRAKLYYSNGEVDVLTSVPIEAVLTVKQCIGDPKQSRCSDEIAVPARDGAEPVRITLKKRECVAPGGDFASMFLIEGDGPGSPSFTEDGRNVIVSWPRFWDPVTFEGVLCAQEEPPANEDPLRPIGSERPNLIRMEE